MGKYTMNDDVFFLIIEAEKEILHEGILSLLVSYLDDRAIYIFTKYHATYIHNLSPKPLPL